MPKDRSPAEISHGIPITYVPARNTIFLSFALAFAEVIGPGRITAEIARTTAERLEIDANHTSEQNQQLLRQLLEEAAEVRRRTRNDEVWTGAGR